MLVSKFHHKNLVQYTKACEIRVNILYNKKLAK